MTNFSFITHYHTIPHFDTLMIFSCGKHCEKRRKGEIACNKQFLLFSQRFLPHMVLIFHFNCTLKCRLQFVWNWTNLKFCSGDGIRSEIIVGKTENAGYHHLSHFRY